MKKIMIISSLVFSSSVFAADLDAGKAIADNCAGCHGTNGISDVPLWPNLAGQKAAYLSSELYAFKTGERVDAMMNGIAEQMSDEDIENVSIYYSVLQP